MQNPRPRPRPLADLLDACLAPALRAQGFASADIIAAWPEIVGPRLAAACQPIRIEWSRRGLRNRDERPQPAMLIVRVEGAFALELQHVAPLLMERINAYYGWRCVGRIVLKQGPVRRAAPLPPIKPALLGEAERQRIAAALDGVAEDGLRTALDRLGAAVLANPGRPER
jgi:hypothetical protein